MRNIYKNFYLDETLPNDTDMAKCIKELISPYEDGEIDFKNIFIAENMRDAIMDGFNPKINDFRELKTGEIVWILI